MAAANGSALAHYLQQECGKPKFELREIFLKKIFLFGRKFLWSLDIWQLPKSAHWPITFNECGKPIFELRKFVRKFFFIGHEILLEFGFWQLPKVARWPITFNECGKPTF